TSRRPRPTRTGSSCVRRRAAGTATAACPCPRGSRAPPAPSFPAWRVPRRIPGTGGARRTRTGRPGPQVVEAQERRRFGSAGLPEGLRAVKQARARTGRLAAEADQTVHELRVDAALAVLLDLDAERPTAAARQVFDQA